MASSSGTSTTSSGGSGLHPTQNSGSDEALIQQLMDQRKRKRMVSNRESARRSRMRKQKHLDQLVTQLSQLRKENNQIMTNVTLTMQHYMSLESENSVLRARVAELGDQLESLNQIIAFMNQPMYGFMENGTELIDEFMNINSVSCGYANQPILASADMIQY